MATNKAESLADLKEAYLVVSDHQALIDEVVARMKARVLTDGDLNLNMDEFDAEETGADEVIMAANMLPFLSDRRVVLVKGVQHWGAKELDKLADYLRSPSPDACLIATFRETRKRPLAKKSALYEAARERHYLLERRGPKWASDYAPWVVDRAKQAGLRMTGDAAAYLVEAVGEDPKGQADRLLVLLQEIEKLALVYEKGARLDRDAVEAMISPYDRASLYEFLDDAFSGKLRDALTDLETLAVDVQPTSVLAGITERLRDLIRVRALASRGLDRAAISRETGQPDWKVKKEMTMAARFSLESLLVLFRRAVDVEEQMKTSRFDERLALDRMTVDIDRAAGQ